MSHRYYIVYASLCVLLAAFFPAMFAAKQERSFSKWYVYSVLLFPVALIHSFLLKKPRHYVNVFFHDKENPSKIKKKAFRTVPTEQKRVLVTPSYIYKVFFSKLLFGAFVGIVFFALARAFVYDTQTLRVASVLFAVIFSAFLSMVEICRFSRLPMIADEITKRTLFIGAISICCSLPIILIKSFILDNIVSERHMPAVMFLCIMISFGLFLVLLFRIQRIFYCVFNKFSDYCLISIASYGVFAACSLIWLSISGLQKYVYLFAMPMQIFSIEYLSGVEYIEKLSNIYSSALVHLFIAVILLLSGLLCRRYKRKELEFRVEYRSKAFRMSRKPILRRHIPNLQIKQQ